MSVFPKGGPPGNWRLKWQEEFTHQLGPKMGSCWPPDSILTPPMNTKEEVACYDPACVTVKGGQCSLVAIEKVQVVEGKTYKYATGVIGTPARIFEVNNYVEFRAKMPGAKGNIHCHTGLWTSAPGWPGNGEIDIVEGLDGIPTFNYHNANGAQNSGRIAGTWTGWHTFGAWYGTNMVTAYWDGKRVGWHGTNGVNAPQWLLASIMLDKWAPIITPCELVLDYIRIWEPA